MGPRKERRETGVRIKLLLPQRTEFSNGVHREPAGLIGRLRSTLVRFFERCCNKRVKLAGASKMSAPLIVSIPHRLGREEATRRLKAGLTHAAASIPILQVDEEKWEGDRLIFRVRALGQTASGHLDVAEDHVRLEVTLPWLLQRFAKAAQVAIRNRGNLLLTKRS